MALYICFSVCCVLFLTAASGAITEEGKVNTSLAVEATTDGLCEVFNPCLNGGKCMFDKENGRSCSCSPGYRGSRCQFVDFCHGDPCNNSTGTCISEKDTYACACLPGFFGKNCNVRDPCLNTTCGNGGTCAVRGTTSYCECPEQSFGKQCERYCPKYANCRGTGRECVYNSGGFTCQCTSRVPIYTVICIMEEDLVNECTTLQNPCNGGRCRDQTKGFLCSPCPAGKSGSRCEVFKPCSTSPCRNGGKCLSLGESYVCSCTRNYQGKNCQWSRGMQGSDICSVTCNATYFEVTCDASLLPLKVRHHDLLTRVPKDNPACTCRFQNKRGITQSNFSSTPTPEAVLKPCKIPYDSCGSNMQVDDGKLVYNNFLRFNDKPRIAEELEEWESDRLITRDRGHFQINLQCRVPRFLTASLGTSIDDFDINDDFSLDLRNKFEKNFLNIVYFKLNRKLNRTLRQTAAFSADNRLYALVSVNDSYEIKSELENEKLRLRDCFATPTADSDDKRRYVLLKDGCPKDQTFRIETDLILSGKLAFESDLDLPKYMAMFSFRPFTFKRLGKRLFVHCDANLCSNGDCNTCPNVTSSRRKRHVIDGTHLDMAKAAGLEYRMGST